MWILVTNHFHAELLPVETKALALLTVVVVTSDQLKVTIFGNSRNTTPWLILITHLHKPLVLTLHFLFHNAYKLFC